MRSGCRMEQPYGAGYDRKDSCASEAEGEEQTEASDDLAPKDAREKERHDRDKDVHFRFSMHGYRNAAPAWSLKASAERTYD